MQPWVTRPCPSLNTGKCVTDTYFMRCFSIRQIVLSSLEHFCTQMLLLLVSRCKVKFWKTAKWWSPEEYYSLLDSGVLLTWYSWEGLLSTSWCPSLCLESLKQLVMLHQFIFCVQFIRAEKSPCTFLKRQRFPSQSLTLFVYLPAYFWPLFVSGKNHTVFYFWT